MCKEMRGSPKGHVVLFPFPAQGHTTPILQFAKRLASKGVKTTLATTVYVSKTMHIKNCNVGIETISDGFDETGSFQAVDYFKSFEEVGSRTLTEIINKYSNDRSGECDYAPVTCLLCDSIIPWGLNVGKKLGLVTGIFYTQSCSVTSMFYHIKQGNLSVPVEKPTVSIPGLPLLANEDLPSCVSVLEGTTPSALSLLMGQFANVENADWLLYNTFEELESEILNWMRELWQVRSIGPTTPSMYLDKRVEGDTENSFYMFKPSDATYIKWLNARENGSVLYISFGSVATLDEEQMEELICGIKQSERDFIWVVREKEQSKLPANFAEEMLQKGLVVPWCSQVEVLAHEAVGCFLTHCGWNSTIEALGLGVPMVAMPNIWDQPTNAKFVEDVWEIGVRVKPDDNGIVRRGELERCIREVMEGESGKVFKANASRWREAAKNAVGAGGSSDLNIDEFVLSITYP
ncbi:hypothetical protein IFM89_031818 [Coptis chinensis]|uniref:Glycosyltransferase n=1 Tax=Coptis chinensis TaxID=261450 RepID=A0A835LS53_9MAGN|nr:hypothetical protein IFM89_031818 [Coptis chinensis]